MNKILAIFSLLALAASTNLMLVHANTIHIHNNCPFTVWPAILGNPGKGQPANGGFALEKYHWRALEVGSEWAGRIWARTKCDANGHCETGDCGKYLL